MACYKKNAVALAVTASLTLWLTDTWAQTFTTTPGSAGVSGTTYLQTAILQPGIPAGFGGPAIPPTIGSTSNFVSLDQFASTANLNAAISGVNSSIAGLGSTVTGLNSAVAGFSSFATGFNVSLTQLGAGLAAVRNEALSGTALAAALTPVLPTGGMQNHINFSSATANGVQAYSVNYARVEGEFDFVAGAAVARNYSLAKVGVGYSW